jgi:hypothetical protein
VQSQDEFQAEKGLWAGDDAGRGVGELAADHKRHTARILSAHSFGCLRDGVDIAQQLGLRSVESVGLKVDLEAVFEGGAGGLDELFVITADEHHGGAMQVSGNDL